MHIGRDSFSAVQPLDSSVHMLDFSSPISDALEESVLTSLTTLCRNGVTICQSDSHMQVAIVA